MERCEPEGQYQNLYDRRLLGAQGYGSSGASRNAQQLPIQPAFVAPGAGVGRNEPHVRQWVLQVDPNPNPEDEQHIDDTLDMQADVIMQENAAIDNDVIDPDLIQREPTQGADEESEDDAANFVTSQGGVGGAIVLGAVHTDMREAQRGVGAADGYAAAAPIVRPKQRQAMTSHPLEVKTSESEQTESYMEALQSTESTPRGGVGESAPFSATGSRQVQSQQVATNRSSSVQHSRAESDCSQASYRSGSRLSAHSRQDTEGGDEPTPSAAAPSMTAPSNPTSVGSGLAQSSAQSKRLNPQGTTTKEADAKPIVKPKQPAVNPQPRKPTAAPQAQSRSKAHSQCLKPTGAGPAQASGRLNTSKTSTVQSRLPAPTRRNLNASREGVDAREQPPGRDPKTPVAAAAGAVTAKSSVVRSAGARNKNGEKLPSPRNVDSSGEKHCACQNLFESFILCTLIFFRARKRIAHAFHSRKDAPRRPQPQSHSSKCSRSCCTCHSTTSDVTSKSGPRSAKP